MLLKEVKQDIKMYKEHLQAADEVFPYLETPAQVKLLDDAGRWLSKLRDLDFILKDKIRR